jgi:MFS family permease
MLQVLRQRNFALLWVGGLISMVGDWVLFVGLPYEIYRQTGSTLATGAMVLALLIPRIVFGSVAGVYVDRWDRRRLMITVNLLLAVFLIPLLAVEALGLWVVYLVLVIESALEQLFTPAEVALLPNLLAGGEEQLVPANALSGVNRHLARLIGPLIGGVVVAAGGLTAVAALDAVSFLVAAGLITAIRYTSPPREPHPSLEVEAVSAWRRLIGEWREGLRLVWNEPVLRALLVFFGITSIGEGLTATLFVPWVTNALHSDAAGYGALLSTQAVGGLAGAVVIGRFGTHMNPLTLVIGGAITFGLIDLVLFTYPIVYRSSRRPRWEWSSGSRSGDGCGQYDAPTVAGRGSPSGEGCRRHWRAGRPWLPDWRDAGRGAGGGVAGRPAARGPGQRLRHWGRAGGPDGPPPSGHCASDLIGRPGDRSGAEVSPYDEPVPRPSASLQSAVALSALRSERR